MKELLHLKEIIDEGNTPEINLLSVDSHPAQIFAAKSAEGKSSQKVALISRQHLYTLSWVLALVSLQGENQTPATQPSPAAATQQQKTGDNNTCLGWLLYFP